MYVYAPCGCNACGAQKRAVDPHELELQKVVNHPVDTGKQTLILCKSSTSTLNLQATSPSPSKCFLIEVASVP